MSTILKTGITAITIIGLFSGILGTVINGTLATLLGVAAAVFFAPDIANAVFGADTPPSPYNNGYHRGRGYYGPAQGQDIAGPAIGPNIAPAFAPPGWRYQGRN